MNAKRDINPLDPLRGIRILDLSHFISGPYCTLLLGAFGAEVIKIEPPNKGELARELGPFLVNAQGDKFSAYYMRMNRNKKSITLNLKSIRGREIFLDLLKISDVLVESFNPQVMESFDLNWKLIKSVNPRIVYASISGFGHADIYPNPFGNRLAFDIIAQALSGIMHTTGQKDCPPARCGAAIGDIFPGALAALGITIALLGRAQNNQGRRVDVAMYDALVSLGERPIMEYSATGRIANRGELGVGVPYNAFQASDGWFVVAVFTNDQWRRFCHAIDRDDMVMNPELATQIDRLRNFHRLIEPVIEAWARNKTRNEVMEILLHEEVAAACVQDAQDVFQCPNLAARNMLVEVKSPVGITIKLPGIPIKISGGNEEIHIHPSQLGEHTEKVLMDLLNISHEEIENLRRQKVI